MLVPDSSDTSTNTMQTSDRSEALPLAVADVGSTTAFTRLDASSRASTLDSTYGRSSTAPPSPMTDSGRMRPIRRSSTRSSSSSSASSFEGQQRHYCRRILAISLLGCVLYVVVDGLTAQNLEKLVVNSEDWLESHPVPGMLVVVFVFILATLSFFPASIVCLGTGFAFHMAFGSVLLATTLTFISVYIGAVLGSLVAFLLGRYLFRDYVTDFARGYPTFVALNRAMEGWSGFYIMLLLRLSPLIPYAALDYTSGVTSISLSSYSAALMIGIIPGTIAFSYVGVAASSFTVDGVGNDKNTPSNKVIDVLSLVFGVVFLFLGVFAASYFSKIELEKILMQLEEEQQTREHHRQLLVELRDRLQKSEQKSEMRERDQATDLLSQETTGGSEVYDIPSVEGPQEQITSREIV